MQYHRFEELWVGDQIRAYCWCGWISQPASNKKDDAAENLNAMEDSNRNQFWTHLSSR